MGAPRPYDVARALRTDAGHAHEHLEGRRADFNGKQVEVVERPVGFRVDIGLEKRVRLVDELFNLVLVETHEPVCLVEPMLTIELDSVGLRKPRILADGHVGAEEHALHVERAIERSR